MAKKHLEVPENEWKFKRQRDGDKHITACASGYPKAAMGKTPRWLEVHHILCVHACSDATFPGAATPDDVKFFKSCMAITPWDINAEPNTIGLPTKQAYVSDVSAAWNLLPCHQVDHDLYLTKVEEYVENKIWKSMMKTEEQKACEEVTPENIEAKFIQGSKVWKAFLTIRGKLYGGAKACLEYCASGQPNPIINDQNWHVPFSMSPDPTAIRSRVKPKPKSALLREGLLAAIT